MKPDSLPYPDELRTIGDHIRKRRLDLGLRQKDVAKLLGVNRCAVNTWETNRNAPRLYLVPRIIDFLGYIPIPEGKEGECKGERIVRVRRALGIRQDHLARQLGIAPSTLACWEHGEREPGPEYRNLLTDFLMTAGPFDRVEPGRIERAGEEETMTKWET